METKTYEQILEEKGRLVYTNVGTSMMPLLRQNRDLMIIDRRPFNAGGSFAPLRKFDPVLYRRGSKYILHRIVAVHDGPPRSYDILGDNQWCIERNVAEDRIIGVMTGVVRDGVETDLTNAAKPANRIYRFVYCDCLPLRRGVIFCRDQSRKLAGRGKSALRKLLKNEANHR